jgi:hypothetical protein
MTNPLSFDVAANHHAEESKSMATLDEIGTPQ